MMVAIKGTPSISNLFFFSWYVLIQWICHSSIFSPIITTVVLIDVVVFLSEYVFLDWLACCYSCVDVMIVSLPYVLSLSLNPRCVLSCHDRHTYIYHMILHFFSSFFLSPTIWSPLTCAHHSRFFLSLVIMMLLMMMMIALHIYIYIYFLVCRHCYD